MDEYKRIEQLEKRIEFLEKMLRMQMGDTAWAYHHDGIEPRDSAHDIGNPDCGSMN